MTRKKGNFLELYIEKIVLGVSVVLSLVMLWILVLSGPHSVEYNGEKYGPGKIDQQIKQQVVGIQERLDEPIERRSYEQVYVSQFSELIDCSIQGISNNVYYPQVPYGVRVQEDDRTYEIPQIGYVSDPLVDAIRMVAHVPLEKVEVSMPYKEVPTELGDIDLVTVQASFDVASLYKNFANSFSGNRVRGDWRDDELAKPVFAGIELQRRKQLGNGSWGQWSRVSRSKVDHLSSLLDVPEDVGELEYGIDFAMAQFREYEIQKGLLQPEAYEFATDADEWLPPEYHKELTVLLKKDRVELKRQGLEMKKAVREASRQARQQAKKQGGAGGMGGGMMGMGMGGGMGGQSKSQRNSKRTNLRDRRKGADSKKGKKEENSIANIFEEFEDRLLEKDTKLANLKEPFIFWAHDDTVEAGNSYQYRIRLGVFNPITGKKWFTKAQEHLEDKVVLWTEFSDVTKSVDIAEMQHLFPLDMSKEVDGAVTLKVAKFHNGRWRSHDFAVRPGQKIGHLVEEEVDESEDGIRSQGMGMGMMGMGGNASANLVDKEIDFSTDAVLVDIVRANVWSGANVLNMSSYMDILYTEDDKTVKHLAVKSKNWPNDIQKEFNRVKRSEDEAITVFYTRGQGGVDRTGKKKSTPGKGMPGMGGMMGPMGGGMMGR